MSSGFQFSAVGSLILALVAQPALAQPSGCAGWRVGPLDDGLLPVGTNGLVYALTSWDADGDGPAGPSLVAGGDFGQIGGTYAGGISVRDASTGQWLPMDGGFWADGWFGTGNTWVRSMTVLNGELIAGGRFTYSAENDCRNVARWDGSHWQPLGAGVGTLAAGDEVRALAVYQGEVIAAGSFTQSGGQTVRRIARWNGSAWQELGGGIGDGEVRAMAVYNNELFVGGTFSQAGGQPANRIARWNGAKWQSVGTGVIGDHVSAFVNYLGKLHVAGKFLNAGGLGVANIARWNGVNWESLGSGASDSILGLTVYNGELIAGGYFTSAGSVPVNKIARWNGSIWQTLASGVTAFDSFAQVHALTPLNGELIAGGLFANAGGQTASNLARWNGGAWSKFGGGTVDHVFAMTNFRSRLVGGGTFLQSTAVNTQAQNIVGFDGAELRPFGSGMNDAVIALEGFQYPVTNGLHELIAGGYFTTAGGVPANRIARWHEDPVGGPPPAWVAMGAGFNGPVLAIERFSGTTYAAGSFSLSGATAMSNIARWNEATDVWQAMGAGLNNAIYALKGFNGVLYAGGAFTGGLARWNGSSWSIVGSGLPGQVYALEVHNGLLVVGGYFPGFAGSPSIALCDGTGFSAPGTGGMTPTRSAVVRALKSLNGNLYAAGTFAAAGGVTADRIAVWNNTGWAALEDGADGTIWTLADFHGELHAGGAFDAVNDGDVASPGWAPYHIEGAAWFIQQPSSSSEVCEDRFITDVQIAGGNEGLTFQWRKNGVPLTTGVTAWGTLVSGTDGPNLHVAPLKSNDAGVYDVVVSNGCGDVTSSPATLTVVGDCSTCLADIAPPDTGSGVVGDGFVNVSDLLSVITGWGTCSVCANCAADINNDCSVSVADLLAVITQWGACP